MKGCLFWKAGYLYLLKYFLRDEFYVLKKKYRKEKGETGLFYL